MRYDLLDTPLGQLTVVVDDDDRLCRLDFTQRALDPAWTRADDPGGLCTKLRAWFSGELGALDALPVKLEGTDFELKVWEALRTIPRGSTW